ncbi:MAG: hypothetical protein PSV24_09995 [Rhodoferax sp.]|nr:hypothetical protein [Rhodoferax sp.]
MTEDSRCCGTGTCLIDAHGRCWCGQQWDGEQMRHPAQENHETEAESTGLTDGAPSAEAD